MLPNPAGRGFRVFHSLQETADALQSPERLVVSPAGRVLSHSHSLLAKSAAIIERTFYRTKYGVKKGTIFTRDGIFRACGVKKVGVFTPNEYLRMPRRLRSDSATLRVATLPFTGERSPQTS
jgi:hypothetical protein